ncbi:2-oxo acid dehydrogenase subunit E2 [[Mycoplasma] mobile]|uniref:2-oxo acid dehydrogenase subunit E2 n=1 Tax=[Mycoplasma] mobile TaxID=2118 RepID=UPI00003756AF|nr:2-oxo acid dehydrogenase subunit E2 [[Mycoplasma] mobile]AAT28068.1 truncated pyruvate dehydrogenase E2 component dihydrolipoamide acetyltransferase [Mycoplasma mobile 163K]
MENKIIITPLAKNLALKLKIDITKLKPSKNKLRIYQEDVLNFSKNSATSNSNLQLAKSQFDPTSQTVAKREKVTPIRKAIAKAMTNSWENVAYTNLVTKIDATSLWESRTRIKDAILKDEGVNVTFLPFIIKAINVSLKKFPILTAKYDEQNSELIYPKTLNLGIAVDTEAGLMVPVIKNADKLNIIEIAKEITRLAVAARDKKIKADELKGSDFTVTNYASVGSLYGVPVINYPDIAIAGIGAIVDKAIISDKGIVAGKVLYLTVAADHRWVDGATIGRFAQEVKKLLENPDMLGVY